MTVERILVRLPNWLGDALMARPLLLALRAAQPAARITACGPAGLLGLLAADGAWDVALPWPAPDGALEAMRREPADAAILCPPSFSSAWFAWRARCRRRIGFRGDARDLLLTDAVDRGARGDEHLGREYLSLGARLGAGEGVWRALPVPEDAREAARRHAGAVPFAVLAPGAIYGPAKRWPAERFAETARRLAGTGLAVLVCGTAADREACDAVVAAAGAGARSFAGATTLAEQAALCALAEVVVCNDSGLAHLAGAVGARTVTVFGSTSSAWTAPIGDRVRVVQHPPVCSPCFRRTCAIGYRCLHAVGVDEVMAATAVDQ